MNSRVGCLITAIASLFAIALPAAAADDGSLVVAIPYELTHVDPLAVNEPVQRILLETAALGLTALAPTGGVEPAFATSVSRSASAAEWRIGIPADQTFASGNPLGPTDVARIFEAYRTVARGFAFRDEVPFMKSLAAISAIQATEEQSEIVFTLEAADPHFLKTVGTLPLTDLRLRDLFGRQFGSGTAVAWYGPLQITEHRPNRGITLHAAPLAGGKRPAASKIVFQFIPKPSDLLRRLQYGQVDIVPLPTTALLEHAAEDPVLLVEPSPLLRLAETSGPWRLLKHHWGRESTSVNELQTDRIIVRKSIKLTPAARTRFDLSGVLPDVVPSASR
ncbi:MAG: hypothetical protein KDD69_04225 [Bdellovibrionales bacterium]|nr:hypothetical protein [Bdellovibrionales bacterium]